MSIIRIGASEIGDATTKARKGVVARVARRVADGYRERSRRQTLRQLLELHDGILDDLGVSRNELSPVSQPQFPADVLAWIGRRR